MLSLKIAILWHQHQPYYKINGKYQLPWVRLHGIKDYYDLPALFFNYPSIKQTINIVPSMIMQAEDYARNNVDEKILNLTRKRADELNDNDKSEILKSFFICNEANMILPELRFAELYEMAKSSDISAFNVQDWLDLQIWYNLTWFGQVSRQRNDVKYLFAKGRNFSEEDKQLLFAIQKDILSEITPTMKRLQDLGNLEISVSPMYHPILPLLFDTNSASEAMPNNILPKPAFQEPQDAQWHLSKAIDFYSNRFDKKPNGLWPPEGAVSNKIMELVAESGIKWVATDEGIMTASFNNSVNRLERFFPRRFKTDKGELIIFFRDRLLSDLIGFNYSAMNPKEAASDFINRLKYVRWEISSHYGEDSLRHAVVPIILDGENCWEFYKDNGKPFLDALFTGLSNEPELRTITFSEATDEQSINYLRPMNYLRAGSWINANFDIWIGQKEHINAWNALREARKAIEEASGNQKGKDIKAAIDEIHIAEGSDWFWWYHDTHQAPNKPDFDIMFRSLLINVYTYLGEDVPKYLFKPFSKIQSKQLLQQAKTKITPDIKKMDIKQWEGAGLYNTSLAMDAMHSSAELLSSVYFGNDDSSIYIRIEAKREISDKDKIKLIISEPFEFTVELSKRDLIGDADNIFQVKIERQNVNTIKMKIISETINGIIHYPRSGSLEIVFVN